MGKSVIEKAYDCFNNQDLEGYVKFFHEEFRAFDLKTGTLVYSGVKDIYDLNKEPVFNKDKLLYANNVVVRGNIEIFYKTYSYKDSTQVVICEIENEMLKTVWFANYE